MGGNGSQGGETGNRLRHSVRVLEAAQGRRENDRPSRAAHHELHDCLADALEHFSRRLPKRPHRRSFCACWPFDIKDEALAVASGFRVRPRVRRALQPALSVGGGEGGSIASGPGGDRRVTLKSANPTLREVLDMLAVSAGEVIWVVTYPPHGLSEGRWQLTVTMGGHPVSPQHQPHWEFLPWGPPSLVKVSGMKPGPIRR